MCNRFWKDGERLRRGIGIVWLIWEPLDIERIRMDGDLLLIDALFIIDIDRTTKIFVKLFGLLQIYFYFSFLSKLLCIKILSREGKLKM